MFYKKGVIQNFANFFFPRPEILLKKRLWHRCFPVKFEKFLRTPILKNIYERLLLENYILTYYNPYIPDILFFKSVSFLTQIWAFYLKKCIIFAFYRGCLISLIKNRYFLTIHRIDYILATKSICHNSTVVTIQGALWKAQPEMTPLASFWWLYR